MPTKKNKSLVVQPADGNVPAYLKKGTGKGNENVGIDDIIIPRLDVIQSMSPARKKSDPAYIEGAEEGLLFNNITRELYGDSVLVIPIFYKMEYLIFKDRDKGGGFRGVFGSMKEAQGHLATLEDEIDDCTILDTAQHFCLVVKDDGTTEEVAMSMSKSKMKTSRKLNSLVRIAGGDRFSRVYEIKTHEEKTDLGDYYNYDVKPAGFPSEPLYEKALKLYDVIVQGGKQIDHDYSDESENEELPF